MPKGLILVNVLLVAGGLIAALFLYGFRPLPLMVALAVVCIFNLIIGVTNSPDNIHSKFREWLFSDR